MSQKSQAEPGGNTKPPDSNQLYRWIITMKKSEEETASQLSQELKVFCKNFTFQLEKGEGGFVHWQIYISLKDKQRFSTVKNLFPAVAHIEPCRDGWKAEAYCRKNDTREEGPWTEKSTFLKTIEKLYPWQKDVEKACKEEPDGRTINWYWEESGNVGKTAFCKYMAIKHKATILGNGAFKDIAHCIGDEPKIVMFNITRDLEERFNYSAVEAIKDGLIFSGKYESQTKIFNCPHVYIFSNFEPRLSAMSLDRWKVMKINGTDLTAIETVRDCMLTHATPSGFD